MGRLQRSRSTTRLGGVSRKPLHGVCCSAQAQPGVVPFLCPASSFPSDEGDGRPEGEGGAELVLTPAPSSWIPNILPWTLKVAAAMTTVSVLYGSFQINECSENVPPCSIQPGMLIFIKVSMFLFKFSLRCYLLEYHHNPFVGLGIK